MELERLLGEVGLQTRDRFGDYGGGGHEQNSARLILAGVAA
jgi:hypothetical protein